MTNPEIVVVSGSYGAGHDAAAEAIAEHLSLDPPMASEF